MSLQDGKPDPRRMRPNGRVVWGLLQIGFGRSAGFAQFGASNDAFLASLAPLVAFLIVISGLTAWHVDPVFGLAFFLQLLCGLLAPAVIADLFCHLWDRRQNWALYANVLNCGQWLMMAAVIVLLPLASVSVAFGLSPNDAAMLLLVAFTIYALWFQWFAARQALNLSRGRAVLVTIGVVFGTGLIVQIPAYLGGRDAMTRLNLPPPAPASHPIAPSATRAT
jgi:hypothetical protein